MTELGRDHTKRTAMLVTVVVNMRQSKANTRQMNVIVILPVLFGPATLREAKIKASKRNTMQTFFFFEVGDHQTRGKSNVHIRITAIRWTENGLQQTLKLLCEYQ